MIERAYTVAEIDRMRRVISNYGWPPGTGDTYFPAQRAAEIEDRLRTYMTAGVEPDDLHTELETRYKDRLHLHADYEATARLRLHAEHEVAERTLRR